MSAYDRFDRWSRRHPVLSWAFAVAVAGDLAFVAVLVGGCAVATPDDRTIAACQQVDAGNPVRGAECRSAHR